MQKKQGGELDSAARHFADASYPISDFAVCGFDMMTFNRRGGNV